MTRRADRPATVATRLIVGSLLALLNAVVCGQSIAGFSTVDISGVTLGTSTNIFYGACIAGNGKAVLVPKAATAIGIYDVSASSLSMLGSLTDDASKYSGCATASDGRVVLAPTSETSITIVDASTSATSAISVSGTNTGGDGGKFVAAAVTADGVVVFAPRNSDYIWRFDVATGNYTQTSTTLTTTQKFGGIGAAARIEAGLSHAL